MVLFFDIQFRMQRNCTIEKFVFEYIQDTDTKYLTIVIIILLGLKLKKKCKKDKNEDVSSPGSVRSV